MLKGVAGFPFDLSFYHRRSSLGFPFGFLLGFMLGFVLGFSFLPRLFIIIDQSTGQFNLSPGEVEARKKVTNVF